MVDCNPRYADARCNPALRHPGRAKHDNLGSLSVAHGHGGRVDPSLQLAALLGVQFDLAACHRLPPDTVIGAALAKPDL